MPRERTPEQDVPLTTRAKRLTRFGRGKDIQLPMGERDRRDPRLPPDVGAALREAGEGLKAVRKLGTRDGAARGNGRSKR